MSIKVGDRIRQNTLSTGVGGVSLVGDVPGFKRFSDVLSSGDITYYVIEENDKFEVGVGIYGSDNLERFHVLSSSNNGNKIELGGSGAVFVTYPADKSVIRDLESQVIVGASGLVFENGTTFKEAKIVELTDVNLAGTPSNQYLIDFNTTNKSLVIGESAGPSNARNTLIGHGAGSGITSGISNTNIGTDAGHKNEQGFKNVSIGDLSGPSDENASISVSRTVNVGYQAGEKSRDDSVNIGFQAGAAAYSRGHVSIGSFSGSGVGNYAFIGGYEAATDHDGDYLVAIGYRAAKDGGGESSVWIGKQAGQDTSSAINSIGLGELSGQGSSGNNSIYLGKKSGKDNADNDMLFVSNNDPSAEGTLIKGNFSTKRLAVGKSDVTLSDTFYVGVNSSTDNGIVVQGASLQSSDLTQWRAFDGLSLASVSNSGTILSNGIAASGEGVRLDSSTPVITDSTLYNVAGSLYWSGSSLTDQISYASGQAIVNEADIAYVSGIIENNTSGDTYVSGIAVYSSGQAIANEAGISYVSGVAVYASGNVYDDSYISGVAVYSSGQAIANQGDISYVSGIAIYASGNVHDDTYISGVATYSSGVLVDGGTLIPDAGKGVAITKGSENFPVTITQDENSSGGVHYIRLTDTDTDNITFGGTDADAFQITASGEGSSGAENILKFSSTANDDHLVFGGITVPTKVLGSNITVNAEGSVELQRGGSTRVRGDSAFTYLFGQTGGYIFYGANALKPQSATSIALGGASNYWGSLYSSNANLKGSAAINVPLTIDAQAAQSANLTEWKASDGVVIAQVSPDGSIATSGDISSSGALIAGELKSPQDTGGLLRLRGSNDTYLDVADGSMDFYCNTGQAFRLTSSFVDVFKTIRPISNQDLGRTSNRWPNLYAVSGSFTGDLNIEPSGSLKVFGVGDSHTNTTNTEFIDIFHSGGHGYIVTDKTGTGGEQNLIIGQKDQFNLEIGQDNGIKFRFGTADRLSINQLCDVQPLGGSNRLGTDGSKWSELWSIDGNFSGSISGARGFFESATTTDSPLTITSAASQTANLQEWRASDDTVIAKVEPDGSIYTSGDIGVSGNVIIPPDGKILFSTSNGEIRPNAGQQIIIAGYQGQTNMVFDRYFNYLYKNSRPIADKSYEFGGHNRRFLAGYFVDVFSSGVTASGVTLKSHVPTSTANTLYNDGGTLMFNGSAVGGGVDAYTSGIATYASGVVTGGVATLASGIIQAGGSLKLYNLGQEGDADTEYLETYTDSNVHKITPKRTGTGAVRQFQIEGPFGAGFGNIFFDTFGFLNLRYSNTSQPAISIRANGAELVRDMFPNVSVVDTLSLGKSTARFGEFYSVDGNFSGDVTVAGDIIATSGILTNSDTASLVHGFAYNGAEKMRFTYNSLEPKVANMSLGSITSGQRWGQFYSVDGSFSGDLSVETGGSFKFYNSGDSHTNTTNTESMSLYSTSNVNYFYSAATGLGTVRDLKLGSSSNNIWFRSAHGIIAFSADGSPRLECTSQGVLVVNSQPLFPWTDNASLCGRTDKRWSAVNSVNGDFSGSVSGARGFFESSTTTDSPLTITSAVSQTANLTEWKNSSDETLTRVTSDGSVHVSGDIVSEQGGEIRNYILGKPGDTDTEYLSIGDLAGIVHSIQAKSTGSGQDRHIRMTSADGRGVLNLYSDGHFNYGFNNNLTFSAFHWGISVSGEIRNKQSSNPSSLGQSTSPFAAGYLNSVYTSGVQTSGVLLNSHVPTVTANTLYNDGGTLMFNGSAVGGGGSVTGTPSGIAFFADDGSLTDHTDLITSSGTNGRRIGINAGTNPTYQLTVGNQVYNQSAVAEIRNYSRGNSILQIVATSGGRSANIKYTSGSTDWYSGHLQASMSGLGSRFVVASYELDNTKPLVYDTNGDFIIGGMVPSARLTVNSRGTTTVNTVFKATASQTANMAEWRASDDVVIAKVTADGSIASSGTVSATNLSVFASGELGDTDSESLTLSSDGTAYDIFSTPTGAGSHRRIDIGGMTGVAYRGLRLDYDGAFMDWQYNNATKFRVDASTCTISTATTVTNDIRSDNHRPLADNTYDSGETGFRWANGYFVNGDFNGTLNASGVSMMRIAEADYPSYQEGTFFYDDENHALAIYNDESETIQRLGQEEFLRVRNNTAETIDTGCAVLITGVHGASVPTVSGAIATSEANSQVVGLANHPIESNSFGYITTFGKVTGVDTSQYSEGDEIFLSSENIGSGVSTSPTVPNYKLSIGHCINSHSTIGSVMVQLGHPKLGGGDTKSVAPVHVSGIPFVSGVADGGSSAVLMYEDGFEYSQGSGLITKAITANSGVTILNDATSSDKVLLRLESSTGTDVLTFKNTNSNSTPVPQVIYPGGYFSMYNGFQIRRNASTGRAFYLTKTGGDTTWKVNAEGNMVLGGSSSLYSVDPRGMLDIYCNSSTSKGVIVQGAAAQSENLTQWQASDEVVVATVAPDGSIASSGNISSSGTITGDSYKIYNVGGDGDTVTEYLELVTEANNYKIQAEQTGGGTIRPIYLDGHSVRFNTSGNARMAVLSNGVYNYVDSIPNADGSVYSGQPNRRWAGIFSHYGEFSNTVSSSGVQASGLLLYDHVPTVTTNKVYNNGGTLTWDGHFAASSKSFLIDHPTKKDAKLQYASLEGPEHGVYVRGRVTENVIELPDHWVGLVDEESITVQLTAKGHPQPNMFVSSIVNNKVYISSDVDIDAFYNVYAERKDVDKLEVEIWQ